MADSFNIEASFSAPSESTPGGLFMTTLVLRRMVKDPRVEYVDLTTSPQMREVNRKLGFVDRTHGVVVVPRALGALKRDKELVEAVSGALARCRLKRRIPFFEFDSPAAAAITAAPTTSLLLNLSEMLPV